MNACVVYFSRTGNTKRLAQAISQAADAKLFDLAQTSPDELASFDLLILGTPVEGASPAKETATYVASMRQVENKKAILFTTYRLFGNERTMKAIEKVLKGKGYETIAKISKKGMKPELQADFTKEAAEVTKVLENLK